MCDNCNESIFNENTPHNVGISVTYQPKCSKCKNSVPRAYINPRSPISYKDILPYIGIYINPIGVIMYNNISCTRFIDILLAASSNDWLLLLNILYHATTREIIIHILFNHNSLVKPSTFYEKLTDLNDTDIFIEYFKDKDIPDEFIDQIHVGYNLIMTHFLYNRGKLSHIRCKDTLCSNMQIKSFEASKILIHGLNTSKLGYNEIYDSLIKSYPKIADYLNQVADLGYETLYEKSKLDKITEYGLPVFQYINDSDSLEDILHAIGGLRITRYGYLYFNASWRYPMYQIRFNEINIADPICTVYTLIEFLVFNQKYELAYQLGEEVPPNNYTGNNYYHIKRFHDEYQFWINLNINNTKSAYLHC